MSVARVGTPTLFRSVASPRAKGVPTQGHAGSHHGAFTSTHTEGRRVRLRPLPHTKGLILGRFHRGNTFPAAPEHRVNGRIRIPEVRVIDANGEALGVMPTDDARRLAREQELDLVEVSPNVRPPVCRLMDYGKFKYEKKKQRSATKSASSSMKIVQMRPKTDDHDLNTKLNRARGFLQRGDKVKIVMRLRGRENAYPERWTAMMREYYESSLAEVARVASRPSYQGRAISMVVEPA